MGALVYAADIGDSFNRNDGGPNLYDQFFPSVAQRRLNVAAPNLRIRNFGISGDTSANVIARMHCLFPIRNGAVEVPRFVSIYVGTNDLGNTTTVQASPSPTTTQIALGTGTAAKMAALGSWLKVGTQASVRVVAISGDTVTLYPALGSTPSAGDAVTIDTTANITEIGGYCNARGCSRLVIGLQHYLNYSGGDTLVTPVAANVTLRAAQQAAATALAQAGVSVAVADYYTAMRNRIVAGTDAAGYSSTLVVAGATQQAFGVTGGTGTLFTAGQRIVIDGTVLATVDQVIGDLVRVRTPLPFAPPTGSPVTGNWHCATGNAHPNPYMGEVMGPVLASAIQAAGWPLN